jgi:hypothetical protein
MNLKQFMERGQVCPICSSNSMDLLSGFTCASPYRYENNNLIFTREMRALNKNNKHYKVEYCIDKITSEFTIEFILNDKRLNYVPLSVLKRFKELDKNIRPYIFSRKCTNCKRYQYWSDLMVLNYKTCNLGDFNINFEYYGVYKKIESKYRIFKIDNDYINKKCIIHCIDSEDLYLAEFLNFPNDRPLTFNISPIKFTTEHEITERLNKLLVFT